MLHDAYLVIDGKRWWEHPHSQKAYIMGQNGTISSCYCSQIIHGRKSDLEQLIHSKSPKAKRNITAKLFKDRDDAVQEFLYNINMVQEELCLNNVEIPPSKQFNRGVVILPKRKKISKLSKISTEYVAHINM